MVLPVLHVGRARIRLAQDTCLVRRSVRLEGGREGSLACGVIGGRKVAPAAVENGA